MIKIHFDDNKIEKYSRRNIHKYHNYFEEVLNESKKKQKKKKKVYKSNSNYVLITLNFFKSRKIIKKRHARQKIVMTLKYKMFKFSKINFIEQIDFTIKSTSDIASAIWIEYCIDIKNEKWIWMICAQN